MSEMHYRLLEHRPGFHTRGSSKSVSKSNRNVLPRFRKLIDGTIS